MTHPTTHPTFIANRYLLQAEVGSGAMGTVYRAHDRLTRRTVALKRINPNAVGRKQSQSPSDAPNLALAREFKILASLRHPHIISVLDYGFDEEQRPFVAMDYLDGAVSLLDYAKHQPTPTVMALFLQLLNALAYLHRRGVLHRDLKPGNVLVNGQGEVKVLDFGLAAEGEPEEGIGGTIAYMAPEILRGQPATPASDLYAVGVMLYQALVGKHPYHTETITELLYKIFNDEPDLTLVPLLHKRDTLEVSHINTLLDDLPTAPLLAPLPTTDSDSPPPLESEAALLALGATSRQPLTLRSVVAKLLAKNPQDRYQDAITTLHQVCSAVGLAEPTESDAIRESFIQAARFVGRETELKTLTQALEAAQKGKGSAWLVGGESGVGKSRLLDEIRIRALVAGLTVGRGQAVRSGAKPFILWRDVLRRLVLMVELSDYEASYLLHIVPDLAELRQRPNPLPASMETTDALRRLSDVVVGVLGRVKEPLLLMFEDVHWGIDLLAAVTARKTHHLILASYRHDEAPQLPDLLPKMKPLILSRLSQQSLAALSQSMIGAERAELVELLQRETEGNAFFVVEVMRALAEAVGGLDQIAYRSLPQRVLAGGMQAVLERRLERIPTVARPLLELAAVAGRELDLDLLGRMMPLLPMPLDQWLVQCSAVLEADERRWFFAHDKLREAILAQIAPHQRPTRHRRVALALETRQDKHDYAALAHHWGQAGETYRELLYCQRAATQALDASALVAAEAYLTRARAIIEATPYADPIERVAVHHLWGDIHRTHGDRHSATQEYEAGLALAESIDDRRGIARCTLGLAHTESVIGKRDEAAVRFERVRQIALEIDEPALYARALFGLGVIAHETTSYDRAVHTYYQALSLFEQLNDTSRKIHVLNNLGTIARNQGRLVESLEYIEQGLVLARRTGDQPMLALSLMNIGTLYQRQERFESALMAYEEALAIYQALQMTRGAANVLLTMGIVYSVMNDPGQAEERWLEAYSIYQDGDDKPGMGRTLHNLGVLWVEQGHYDKARRYFEASRPIDAEVGNQRGVMLSTWQLGKIALGLGNLGQAAQLMHEALQQAHALNLPEVWAIITGLGEVKAKQGEMGLAVAYWRLVVVAGTASADAVKLAREALARAIPPPAEVPIVGLEDIVAG